MKTLIFLLSFVWQFSIIAQTITIGKQVWMTKNLNVSEFRNGDPIPMAATKEEWDRAGYNKKPAWCYYNNDPATAEKYGKLYNWYAVTDPRGLAPIGYHVPSDIEWSVLKNRLGADIGTKLKSTDGWATSSVVCPECAHWNLEYRRKVPCHKCLDTRIVPAPGSGTDKYGFSANPGGYRHSYGLFEGFGSCAAWWGSTNGLAYPAGYYKIDPHGTGLKKGHANKGKGMAVRCIKD